MVYIITLYRCLGEVLNNYKIFGSIIFPKYNDHLKKRISENNIPVKNSDKIYSEIIKDTLCNYKEIWTSSEPPDYNEKYYFINYNSWVLVIVIDEYENKIIRTCMKIDGYESLGIYLRKRKNRLFQLFDINIDFIEVKDGGSNIIKEIRESFEIS